MNRRNKAITFFIALLLSYGSLYATIGPEKVREWHQQRWHHDGHHHHQGHGYHDHDANPSDEAVVKEN